MIIFLPFIYLQSYIRVSSVPGTILGSRNTVVKLCEYLHHDLVGEIDI